MQLTVHTQVSFAGSSSLERLLNTNTLDVLALLCSCLFLFMLCTYEPLKQICRWLTCSNPLLITSKAIWNVTHLPCVLTRTGSSLLSPFSLSRLTIYQLLSLETSEIFLFLLSALSVNIQPVIRPCWLSLWMFICEDHLELKCSLLILDLMVRAIFYPIFCFLILQSDSVHAAAKAIFLWCKCDQVLFPPDNLLMTSHR